MGGGFPGEVAPTSVGAMGKGRNREGWTMFGTVDLARRTIRSFATNTEDGYGGLAELQAVAELRQELDDAIDVMVRWLFTYDDASCAEIAAALNVTQQAVAKRWPGVSARPAGGQIGRLR